MLKQVNDLLSFKAFKPSKLDVKIPLKERFCGIDPIMGIAISKDRLTCAEIQFHKNDEISVNKIKHYDLKSEEEITNAIAEFAKDNKLSSAMVLESPQMQIIKLEKSLPQKGIDRLSDVKCRMNSILGEPAEAGRVYAYVSNPQFPETLVFSYDQVKIDYTVNIVNNAGLDVVLMSCGLYVILDYLLNEEPEFFQHERVLFIYSSDSLIFASIAEGRLQQIGFRGGIEKKDLECHILGMMGRFEYSHTQISYVNCSDWDIQGYFNQHYPALKVIPIFEDSYKGIFQAACHG